MKITLMKKFLDLKDELGRYKRSVEFYQTQVDDLSASKEEAIRSKATAHKNYQETLEKVRVLQEELGVDNDDRV